jgi:hypothetical protein
VFHGGVFVWGARGQVQTPFGALDGRSGTARLWPDLPSRRRRRRLGVLPRSHPTDGSVDVDGADHVVVAAFSNGLAGRNRGCWAGGRRRLFLFLASPGQQ